FDLVVTELNNTPTEGPVWIFVPKQNNYFTLSMNSSRMTSVTNPAINTDAGNWTLDENPFFYIIKTNPSYFVGGNTSKYIPLKFTKTGSLTHYELKSLTFEINPATT